jgi:hypothetical protein
VSSALPEFVLHWARALGSNDTRVIALKGGMNSRVFSCVVADKRFVIKGYLPLEIGHRDRFAAEKQFLLYSNAVASGYVPQVLHVDDQRRCIVMEYLDGDAYPEGSSPGQQDIDAAVRFFSLLNEDPLQATAEITMDAAEGFLRISAHLENVRDRLKQMAFDHLPLEFQPTAKLAIRLLRDRFEPVEKWVQKAIGTRQVEDALPTLNRCVSPSDFGFHNAIRTAKGVKFFDFEFGGLDDPAKAAIDFVLQPNISVRNYGLVLLKNLDFQGQQLAFARATILTPVLELKWKCIIVGFLQSARFTRMTKVFSNEKINQLLRDRLDTTVKKLSGKRTFDS